MRITIEIDGNEQTIDLPEDTVRELTAIASRNGISFATALQQAIATENFLESQQAAGGKLIIQKGDELHEVVREPSIEEALCGF